MLKLYHWLIITVCHSKFNMTKVTVTGRSQSKETQREMRNKRNKVQTRKSRNVMAENRRSDGETLGTKHPGGEEDRNDKRANLKMKQEITTLNKPT